MHHKLKVEVKNEHSYLIYKLFGQRNVCLFILSPIIVDILICTSTMKFAVLVCNKHISFTNLSKLFFSIGLLCLQTKSFFIQEGFFQWCFSKCCSNHRYNIAKIDDMHIFIYICRPPPPDYGPIHQILQCYLVCYI